MPSDPRTVVPAVLTMMMMMMMKMMMKTIMTIMMIMMTEVLAPRLDLLVSLTKSLL